MAVAILWGVFYHTNLIVYIEPIMWIKKLGYGCVDLFFFASGIGCFYSLKKDSDPLRFMKRRASKILPAYWIILAVWLVFRNIAYGVNFYQVIANILCIQEFTTLENNFNWYISAMLLFYLLAPLFYRVVEKGNLLSSLAFTALLVVISLPFVDPLKMTFSRLPIFFIGMVVAGESERTIGIKTILPTILLSIVGFVAISLLFAYYKGDMWNNGLFWYPFILITPGLCLALSLLGTLLDRSKFGKGVLKVFDTIGSYTLEWYLVHVLIFEIYRYMVEQGFMENNKVWFVVTIISIVVTIPLIFLVKLYHRCAKNLAKKQS